MDESSDVGHLRRGKVQLQGVQESPNEEVRKPTSNDENDECTAMLIMAKSGESTETAAGDGKYARMDKYRSKSPKTSCQESSKALENIWVKTAVKGKRNPNRQNVIEETQELLTVSFLELTQDGKRAHQEWARVQQELDLANECISSKTHEIERLRALDSKNRENISKLLRTVTSTNETTKEQSQANVSEARLRSDLRRMTKCRDETDQERVQVEKQCKLLEKELSEVKSKLQQEQQAKKKMERDQQATNSLVKALHSSNQPDVNYYKRKVTELNTHVQGLTSILAERNREIESLRREKDRFLSQNQQSSRHREGSGSKRSRK